MPITHNPTMTTLVNIITIQMAIPKTMPYKFNLFAALVVVRAATY